MKKYNITELLIYILSAELAGALSGIASGGGFGAFYQSLARPPLSPPGWLFPIAWTLLYLLMGIAAYQVRAAGGSPAALRLYWVQLGVNFLWSPVFFGLHALIGAAVVISVLTVLVAVTAYLFGRCRRSAGLLLLPYLVWTAYASYLSIGVAVLN